MEKIVGFSGLLLFLFGLVSAYLQTLSLSYSYTALCIGLFLFFDSLDFYLRDESLLNDYTGYNSPLIAVLLGGIFIGFVIEFYGVLTGMWGSMYYSSLGDSISIWITDYYIDMTISYGFLILPSFSLYRVLTYELEKGKEKNYNSDLDLTEQSSKILLTGLIMLMLPLLLILQDLGVIIRFSMFATSLLGLWFVLEYFEFRKHKRGLLKDLLTLRFDRLAALVSASIFIGYMIELLNLFNQGWAYSREIPLVELKFFGVPIIILFGWIPLLAICLSFFNIFFRSKEPLF